MRQVLITAALLVALSCCYGSESEGGMPQCARAAPGKDTPLASNRMNDSWDPLFSLNVKHDGGFNYNVTVRLGRSAPPFSDAFISAETNSSCGVGDLLYDSEDFLLVTQDSGDCPHVLTTNRKQVMFGLPPLQWKMPKCGCVHFRVTIIVDGQTYLAERKDVMEGPLAMTLCAASPGSTYRKLSREDRVDMLCKVNRRFSGAEVLQRPEFLERHHLQAKFLESTRMELALHARRSDILDCCQKPDAARKECFDDVRRRRVDDFCDDGSPEIPFASHRIRFMRDREQACCWRIGEARYDCFALNAGTKHGAWSPDFSLDESDPVNDLGDYPTEILGVEEEYGTPFFGVPATIPHPQTTGAPALTTTTVTTTPAPTSTTSATTTSTTAPLEDRQSIGQHGAFASKADRRSSRESQIRPNSDFDDVAGVRTSSRERKGRRVGKSREPSPWEQSPVEGESSLAVSRELGEQQGGRSAYKTQSKLRRRIWKMQLKTKCCQAAMNGAVGLFGAFQTVWEECKHSSHKFMQTVRMRDGRQICMNEFRFCCMDMATSLPTDVVTWQPDPASSSEWDRDSDLVGKDYLPPHARSHHVQTTRRTSPVTAHGSATSRSSRERSWLLRGRGIQPRPAIELAPPELASNRGREEKAQAHRMRSQLEEEDDIDEDYRPVMKDTRRSGLASNSPASKRKELENSQASSEQRSGGDLGENPAREKEPEVKRTRSRIQEVNPGSTGDHTGKEVQDRKSFASLETIRRRLKTRRRETEEEMLRWLLMEVDQDHLDDLVDEDGDAPGSEEVAAVGYTDSGEYEDDDGGDDAGVDDYDSREVDRDDDDVSDRVSRARKPEGKSDNSDNDKDEDEKGDRGGQAGSSSVRQGSNLGARRNSERGSPIAGHDRRQQSSATDVREQTVDVNPSEKKPKEGLDGMERAPVVGRPDQGSGRSGIGSREVPRPLPSSAAAAQQESSSERDDSAAPDDLSGRDGHNSRYHSGGRSTRRGRKTKARPDKRWSRRDQAKSMITEALEEE